MPDLFYGTGAYRRDRGTMPDLPVLNMVVEKSPAAKRGFILQSRPGMIEAGEVGSGPIHGMYQRSGAIGGNRYTVSGGSLYKDTTSLGAVAGSGPVSFAASPYNLLLTRGATLYSYNGSVFAAETVPGPDGEVQEVRAVAHLAGYEIAIIKGTNKFNFRLANATEWDGLDYANAENEPDELIDVQVIDDILVLLGSESVEFWPKTGDATIPFRPMDGRVFEKGVIDTGCACRFDNTMAWIGNEGVVYVSANVPTRISDAGIEERIEKSSSYALYSYFFEGTEYLALRLSQGTWIFSAASKEWSEFGSYDRSNWRANCVAQGPIFGDDETGKLWVFHNDHVDAGGVLERRIRAALSIEGGAGSVNNLRVACNPGTTKDLNDQYSSPVIEMRRSRDGGRTWSEWRPTKLGVQGDYRQRSEWRALGMFDDPGAIFEFRVTDPVDLRISNIAANEPTGGRSR